MRIRKTRRDLIAPGFTDDEHLPFQHKNFPRPTSLGPFRLLFGPASPEKLALVLSDCSPQLVAIERYERRALSRRKFAIRAFDEACQAIAAQNANSARNDIGERAAGTAAEPDRPGADG
jgi:hypothetical protein